VKGGGGRRRAGGDSDEVFNLHFTNVQRSAKHLKRCARLLSRTIFETGCLYTRATAHASFASGAAHAAAGEEQTRVGLHAARLPQERDAEPQAKLGRGAGEADFTRGFKCRLRRYCCRC
jgi:hypothetical protein